MKITGFVCVVLVGVLSKPAYPQNQRTEIEQSSFRMLPTHARSAIAEGPVGVPRKGLVWENSVSHASLPLLYVCTWTSPRPENRLTPTQVVALWCSHMH